MVKKNIVDLGKVLTGNMGGAVFAFLAQMLLARVLDVDEFGALLTNISFLTIMGTMASYGLGLLAYKQFAISKETGLEFLRHAMGMLFLLSLFAISIVVLVNIYKVANLPKKWLSLVLIPIVLSQAFQPITAAIFQINQDFTKSAGVQSVQNLLRLLVVVMVFALSGGLIHVAVGYSIVSFLSFFWFVLAVKNKYNDVFAWSEIKGKFNKVFYFEKILYYTKVGLPYAITGFVGLVYLQVDILIIGTTISAEDAAHFGLALAVLSAVYILPMSFFNHFLAPRLFYWGEHDLISFRKYFYFSNGIFIGGGLLLGCLISFLSPYFIKAFFGEKYLYSIEILSIVSFCIPLRFLSIGLGSFLAASGDIRNRAWFQFFSLLFKVGITFILAKEYAIIGVIISFFASETFLLGLYCLGSQKVMRDISANISCHEVSSQHQTT